jgi:hypothetical protein
LCIRARIYVKILFRIYICFMRVWQHYAHVTLRRPNACFYLHAVNVIDYSHLHTSTLYDIRWWIACKMIRVAPSHWIYCVCDPSCRTITQVLIFVHRDFFFPRNASIYIILFFHILWIRILTSNAKRDIAVAKNMQITIPANVRYLGPISSRATIKFTVLFCTFFSFWIYFFLIFWVSLF